MQFQGNNTDVVAHPSSSARWIPDERDGFISWLRSEFAAANAIIDAMCYHLKCVGDSGEYDAVFGCIQQRRMNWTHVLHFQQYYSVGDVTTTLQQVAWRKEQKQSSTAAPTGFKHYNPIGGGGYGGGAYSVHPHPHVKSDGKKPLGNHHRFGNKSLGIENHEIDVVGGDEDSRNASLLSGSKIGSVSSDLSGSESSKVGTDGSTESSSRERSMEEEMKGNGGSVVEEANGMKCDVVREGVDHSNHVGDHNLQNGRTEDSVKADSSHPSSKGTSTNSSEKDDVDPVKKQDKKPANTVIPKTFTVDETFGGKQVNVVEGLELYEDLLDSSEVSQLFSLTNELRAAGRKGELQGQTFVACKRPMKGRGREMIQLGIPIIDGPPENDNRTAMSRDRKVEPIPSAFQDVIDRLVQLHVMKEKADSIIIDFFNEGDHSHPHSCPLWFGRPFCTLLLTKCSMVFGRVIVIDHPGDYRGALKLPLTAGSLLAVQGRSADFAKHAIPSIKKHRVIVTFVKSQPKKSAFVDGVRYPPMVPTGQWISPPRFPMMIHPGPNHFNVVHSTGVLAGPPPHMQHLPSGDIHSMFLGASVATPATIPYLPAQTPVSIPVATANWPVVARPPPPRVVVPGTGVFIPPSGSGHTQSHSQSAATGEVSPAMEVNQLPQSSSSNGQTAKAVEKVTDENVLDPKSEESSTKTALVQDCNDRTDNVDESASKEDSCSGEKVNDKSDSPVKC